MHEQVGTRLIFASNLSKGQILQALKLKGTILHPYHSSPDTSYLQAPINTVLRKESVQDILT